MSLLKESAIDRIVEDCHLLCGLVLQDAYEAGNFLALLAGLAHAASWPTSTPFWVLKGAEEELVKLVFDQEMSKRGRCANIRSRIHQDMVHFHRWEEVGILQRLRTTCREELEAIRMAQASMQMHDGKAGKEADRLNMILAAIGNSKESVYQAAHRTLGWGFAFGSPETIKASARFVDNHTKRFFLVPSSIYIALGYGNLINPQDTIGKTGDLIFGELREKNLPVRHYADLETRLFGEPPKSKPAKRPIAQSKDYPAFTAALPLELRSPVREGTCDLLERAVINGNLFAHLNALQLFRTDPRTTPAWLLRHTLRVLLTLLAPVEVSQRGQGRKRVIETRNELLHFVRYHQFELIQILQASRAQTSATRSFGQLDPYLEQRPRWLSNSKRTLAYSERRIFEEVSRQLQGTQWAGTPESVKKSIQLMRTDAGLRARRWLPDPGSLPPPEIPGVWSRKMGNEFGELFIRFFELHARMISGPESPGPVRDHSWQSNPERGSEAPRQPTSSA